MSMSEEAVFFHVGHLRLEGRLWRAPGPHAVVLSHPHPLYGGALDNPVVAVLTEVYQRLGYSTLRFNFRGVGASEGRYAAGQGEQNDVRAAAAYLAGLGKIVTDLAGYSFGAWIGMQLLMRRPEVKGFISIAPPANLYDFGFLAPCPSSGVIVAGTGDEVVTEPAVQKLVDKLKTQKGIVIEQRVVPGANHFFDGKNDELMSVVGTYLDKRLPGTRKDSAA